MSPQLILIAGPSGSGKSTVAHALAAELGTSNCQLIELDNYYRDLSHLSPEERKVYDYDQPEAWERERLVHELMALKSGQAIDRPAYDFCTHTRKAETVHIEPRPYLITEGLFALCYPELSAVADHTIFIDLDDENCLQRRIQRDVCERGRSIECVTHQFQNTVLPAIREHIRPSAKNADLALNGQAPLHDLLRPIEQQIRENTF